MDNKFEIKEVLNKTIGGYEVKNYNGCLKTVQEACKIAKKEANFAIKDDFEYANIKAQRSLINKAKKICEDRRKDFTKKMLGTYQEQLATLERMLKKSSEELTSYMNAYDDSKKPVEVEQNQVVSEQGYTATFVISSSSKEETLLVKGVLDKIGIKYDLKETK